MTTSDVSLNQLFTLIRDLLDQGLVIPGFSFTKDKEDNDWILKIRNTTIRFMDVGINGAYSVSKFDDLSPITVVIGQRRLQATMSVLYRLNSSR
jgi:hypothetical protein